MWCFHGATHGIDMTEYSHKYEVELRDKAGNLKQYLTPWVEDLQWEWNRIGGCGNCRVKLAMTYRKIDFDAGDDIQIRIKSGSTTKLVYRGWIIDPGHKLREKQSINLEVRGYFDKLKKIAIHDSGAVKQYTSTLVSDIVDNIVDTFITPNSDITKGTIDAAIFTADSLKFKTSVAAALRTLAELIGDAEYGVNENLVFFWRTESTTLRQKFFVGNNVEVLDRKINWDKLINKIVFEGGTVGGATFTKTAEATDSQLLFYLSEVIETNSAITTDSVADQYLGAILKEYSKPIINFRAKIPNTDLRLEDTLPIGEVSFYDAEHDESVHVVGEVGDGGSDLTIGLTADGGSNATIGGAYSAQVERISYKINDTEERFNIEISLGDTILETSAKIRQIEQSLDAVRQR